MKKYISLLVFVVLVFTMSVQATQASSDVSGNGRDEAKSMLKDKKNEEKLKREEFKQKMEKEREEMKQKQELFKEQIKTSREEAKTKLETLKESLKTEKDINKLKIKELRISGREKAMERFDEAVTKLQALTDKVNGFVTKLKAKNVDTTTAEALVATSASKLDSAKAKIAEIHTLLAKSVTELTAADKTQLTTLAKDTQSLLKESKAALKDATKALKDKVQTGLNSKKTPENETEVETEKSN